MRPFQLLPDCGNCAGLCCVAPSFDASEDFAFSKPAGHRCRYLRADCRCAIHASRLERGFAGCVAYDCHGAGQWVTRAFAGRALSTEERDRAFLAIREAFEWLWVLEGARARLPAGPVRDAVVEELAALERVVRSGPDCWEESVLAPHRRAVRDLLKAVQGVVQVVAPPSSSPTHR